MGMFNPLMSRTGITLPFIGNDDSDVGGAGEGDVVDGVDHLWEDQGIGITLLGQWSVKD